MSGTVREELRKGIFEMIEDDVQQDNPSSNATYLTERDNHDPERGRGRVLKKRQSHRNCH